MSDSERLQSSVHAEDPRQDAVEALLRAGDELARTLYPADECFLLPIDELARPGTTVFVARDDASAAVGMAALVEQGSGFGELKRLFVLESSRGRGVAGALMDAVERAALERGIHTLRLETGTRSDAALRFYGRRGYARIPAFGAYIGSATSVCMERSLT